MIILERHFLHQHYRIDWEAILNEIVPLRLAGVAGNARWTLLYVFTAPLPLLRMLLACHHSTTDVTTDT
jgi:hypothetical protein